MAGQRESVEAVIGRMLRDIEVELADEFDRNFERQAFFTREWARRRSPLRPGGHILVDTGGLRRSIRTRIGSRGVTFYSEHPAAAIHNAGGRIRVTERMRRYFWARYYETRGAFGRRKDGSYRRDRRNARLSDAASFWRAMALMKPGAEIVIPQRQFLGDAPEVREAVKEIIAENMRTWLGNIDNIVKQ